MENVLSIYVDGKVQDTIDDDDDCVILEGDPAKMALVEENQDSGSDDLIVLGEKGEVACRDYPHSRHLCVKYPFSSTLHNCHCEQCHCYVCDVIAPCEFWGTGLSTLDHCHATDKQDDWKTVRKSFKLKKCSSFPATTVLTNTSSSAPFLKTTKIPDQVQSLTRPIAIRNNHVERPAVLPPLPKTAVCSVPPKPAVLPFFPRPVVRPAPPRHAVRPYHSGLTLPSRSMKAHILPPVPAIQHLASNIGVHYLQASDTGAPNLGSESKSNRFSQSSNSQNLPETERYKYYTSQKVRHPSAMKLGPRPAVFKNQVPRKQ